MNLTWTELTDLMRETDSNMPTERSMINLQPPASSDPHLPTTHAEPPPYPSSPSLALSVSLSFSSRSPSTSDAIPYQPRVLLSSHSDTKAVGVLLLREELGEGLGAGGLGGGRRRVCTLDVPILTWPPWGYTHDKHQISLTKTAVPQRRTWHG